MARFFRIAQTRWAASTMTGEGARLFGGRWNPQGVAAVYLAESRALAALEILVHAPREALPLDWSMIEVEVPDGAIEQADMKSLPGDWRNLPSSPGARRFGERWLKTRAGLAMKLPSVIVPEEYAVLLNPLHPSAAQARVIGIHSFRFDTRLAVASMW